MKRGHTSLDESLILVAHLGPHDHHAGDRVERHGRGGGGDTDSDLAMALFRRKEELQRPTPRKQQAARPAADSVAPARAGRAAAQLPAAPTPPHWALGSKVVGVEAGGLTRATHPAGQAGSG
jgi:hypothetical protein